MTGFLRLTTSPEMAADHERRIRELERRLRASQSDIARGRRTDPAGSRIAIFNNPGSTLIDTNYHEFTQGWAAGDTSWFTWPAPGYGGDQSRIGLNETGIYTVTGVLFFSAAAGYGRVIEEVSGAIFAPSSGDGITGHDDVSMAGALILETVEDFPVVRLFTSPANVVSARLSIQYHGDFEYVTP